MFCNTNIHPRDNIAKQTQSRIVEEQKTCQRTTPISRRSIQFFSYHRSASMCGGSEYSIKRRRSLPKAQREQVLQFKTYEIS
jgi:hypothetical protein